MSELTFSQSERRNFLLPVLLALIVVGGAFGYVYLFPHHIADINVTHTAILPTNTVFANDSMLVGHHDESENDLFVVTTLRIDNRLKIPLTIDAITGTLTPQNENADPSTVTATQKNDLDSVYMAFPALKPLAGAPLLRESTIPPGGHVEGMVLLNFPSTEADWNHRKSATVTIAFYHHDPFTITIPKDQGTGNSR